MNGDFTLVHREYDPDSLKALSLHLAQRNAYRITGEANWRLSSNNIVAAFDGKKFYLLDLDFVPLLEWESDSNLMACGISISGRYAACMTAHNTPEFEAEDAVLVLFDVDRKCAVAAKRNLGIGINGIEKIYIDDRAKDETKYAVFVYIKSDPNEDPASVKFDFNLVPDEKSLDAFYEVPGHSPYLYNNRAITLIGRMAEKYSSDTEGKVLRILSMIDGDPKMSPYQLSLTYKALGDVYAGQSMSEKALSAYSKGLALNPKLPVKKKVKELTSQISKEP